MIKPSIVILSLIAVTSIIMSVPGVSAEPFNSTYIKVGPANGDGDGIDPGDARNIINITTHPFDFHDGDVDVDTCTDNDDVSCTISLDQPHVIRGKYLEIRGNFDSTHMPLRVVTNGALIDPFTINESSLFRQTSAPNNNGTGGWSLFSSNLQPGENTLRFELRDADPVTLSFVIDTRPDFRILSAPATDDPPIHNFFFPDIDEYGLAAGGDLTINCTTQTCIESDTASVMDNSFWIVGKYYDEKPTRVTIAGKSYTDITTHADTDTWFVNVTVTEGDHVADVYTNAHGDRPAISHGITVDLAPRILSVSAQASTGDDPTEREFVNGALDYQYNKFFIRGIYHPDNLPSRLSLAGGQIPSITNASTTRTWYSSSIGPLADNTYLIHLVAPDNPAADTKQLTINTDPKILYLTVGTMHFLAPDIDPDTLGPLCTTDTCVSTTDTIRLTSSAFTVWGSYTDTAPAHVIINGEEFDNTNTPDDNSNRWSIPVKNIADGNHTVHLYVGSSALVDQVPISINTMPMIVSIQYDSNADGSLTDADMTIPFKDSDVVIRSTPFAITGTFVGVANDKPDLIQVGVLEFAGAEIEVEDDTNWKIQFDRTLRDGTYTITVYDGGILQAEADFELDSRPSMDRIVVPALTTDDPDATVTYHFEPTDDQTKIPDPLSTPNFTVYGSYSGSDIPVRIEIKYPNNTQATHYLNGSDTTPDAGVWSYNIIGPLTDTGIHTVTVTTQHDVSVERDININTEPRLEYALYDGNKYVLMPRVDSITIGDQTVNCSDTTRAEDVVVTCTERGLPEIMSGTFTLHGPYVSAPPSQVLVNNIEYTLSDPDHTIMDNEDNTWSISVTLPDGTHRINVYDTGGQNVYSQTIRVSISAEILYFYDMFNDQHRYWFMPGLNLPVIADTITNAAYGGSADGLVCGGMVTCTNLTDGYPITANTFTVHGTNMDNVGRVEVDRQYTPADDPATENGDRWLANITLSENVNGDHTINLFNKVDRDPIFSHTVAVDITPTIEAITVDDDDTKYYLFPGTSENTTTLDCTAPRVECITTDSPTLTINSKAFVLHGGYFDYDAAVPNYVYVDTALFSTLETSGNMWQATISEQSDDLHMLSVVETDFGMQLRINQSVRVDTAPVFQYLVNGDTYWLLPGVDADDVEACDGADRQCVQLDDLTANINDFSIGGIHYSDSEPTRLTVDGNTHTIISGIGVDTWEVDTLEEFDDGTYRFVLSDRYHVPIAHIEIVIDTAPSLQFLTYDDTYWILDDSIETDDVVVCQDPQHTCMYMDAQDVESMRDGDTIRLVIPKLLHNDINAAALAIGGSYYNAAIPTQVVINGEAQTVTTAGGSWTSPLSGLDTGSHDISLFVGNITRLAASITVELAVPPMPMSTSLTAVTGDWDGDGDTDVGSVGFISDPNGERDGHQFFTLNANGSSFDNVFTGAIGALFQYNPDTLMAVTGDWDGDGDTDAGAAGVVLRSSSYYFTLNANGTAYDSVFEGAFGNITGYMPGTVTALTGDWDGDGDTEIGIGGISMTGMHHVMLSTGDNETSAYLADASAYSSSSIIVGDWDGDGADDVGSVGIGSAGLQHFTLFVGSDIVFEGAIGNASDYASGTMRPVVGDWDGDGDTDVGVVGIDSRGLQHFTLNGNGTDYVMVFVGAIGDSAHYVPGTLTHVVGDWDGDGDTDVGAVGLVYNEQELAYLQHFTLNANGYSYETVFAGAIGDVADYQ